MANYDVPIGGARTSRKLIPMGIYRAIVKVPRDCSFPVLPVRRNGSLVFPVGVFSGTWTGIELLKAEEVGTKILAIKKGIIFPYHGNLFHDYIMRLYEIKKSSDRKSMWYLVSKLLMNSLYGKFGQSMKYKKFYMNPSSSALENMIPYDLELGIFYREVNELKDFMIPEIATFITSYSRLTLYKYFEMALNRGGKLYYCDTDSLITDVELLTGVELGEIKLEDKIKRGIFLAPKLYAYESEDGSYEVKAKGFVKGQIFKGYAPYSSLEDKRKMFLQPSLKRTPLSYSSYEQALKGNWDDFVIELKKFAGTLEGLKRFKSFFVELEMRKKASGIFKKRVLKTALRANLWR